MQRKRSVGETCAQRGMTLVEVMVVMAIIGIVAGLVGVYAIDQKIQAERRAAKVQIAEFISAVDTFVLSFRKHPTELELLSRPPGSGPPIVRRIPKDPWGNPYVYVQPGVHNPGWFDLSSNGPDGQPDTEDDICNWTEFVE